MIAIHPGDRCPRMQFYDTYVVASLVPERAEAGSGLPGDAIALRRYAHPRPGPGTSHACRRDPDAATHAQSPSGDRALCEGRREIADLCRAQVRADAGEVRPPGASHNGAATSLPPRGRGQHCPGRGRARDRVQLDDATMWAAIDAASTRARPGKSTTTVSAPAGPFLASRSPPTAARLTTRRNEPSSTARPLTRVVEPPRTGTSAATSTPCSTCMYPQPRSADTA